MYLGPSNGFLPGEVMIVGMQHCLCFPVFSPLTHPQFTVVTVASVTGSLYRVIHQILPVSLGVS